MNKITEIQSLLCDTINKSALPYGAEIFYTIPQKATMPYIKISKIVLKTEALSNPDLCEAAFSLIICTAGPSSKKVLEIMQSMQDILPQMNSAEDQGSETKIHNAYLQNPTISEEVDRKTWIGICELVLICS